MLKLLNSWSHGFVVVPPLSVLINRNVLQLLKRESLLFEELQKDTGANSGYLMASIRMLVSLGWIEQKTDRKYVLKDLKLDEKIPNGLLEIINKNAISPQADEKNVDVFNEMLNLLKNGWGLDDVTLRPMLDGALLVPVMLKLWGSQPMNGNLFKPTQIKGVFKRALDPSRTNVIIYI